MHMAIHWYTNVTLMCMMHWFFVCFNHTRLYLFVTPSAYYEFLYITWLGINDMIFIYDAMWWYDLVRTCVYEQTYP